MKKIIVTGGAGYIGSHICIELLSAGYDLLVIDDLSNSDPEAIKRVEEITERSVKFLKADLASPQHQDQITQAINAFGAEGAIHLAGLKAVGESVEQPARYYRVNISAALNLIAAMSAVGAKKLVFSSSATVYGDLNASPVDENGKLGATNPYGRTKLFIEHILKDIAAADTPWRICNLRYFNPVGAHPSGRIGEDPQGWPNNLFPFIAQVAIGRRDKLSIFGDDYPTADGTGVRDYIHVCDLAKGHLAALRHLDQGSESGAIDINLGAGHGVSVKEALASFSKAVGKPIPYEIISRRPGDVAEIFANVDRAAALLDWCAKKTLDEMCADHWRWQRNNPNGYRS